MAGQQRPAQTPRTPMRADAEHNRAKILDAARAALAVSGEASMQAIAKQAGIGQGTLYRNFPNREALVLAVHRHDVQALVDAAPELLATHPPLDALRLWFDHLASYGRIKHGLAGALHTATRAELEGEGYGPVLGAIELLISAGQSAGTIRPDLAAEEVLLLVGFLWRIDPDADFDNRARHLLDLVMDALSSRWSPAQ